MSSVSISFEKANRKSFTFLFIFKILKCVPPVNNFQDLNLFNKGPFTNTCRLIAGNNFGPDVYIIFLVGHRLTMWHVMCPGHSKN